jgi:hypothetical protein
MREADYAPNAAFLRIPARAIRGVQFVHRSVYAIKLLSHTDYV